MKIRTQDAMQCVEFGDCYVVADSFGVRVCIKTPNNPNVILAGSYGDEARARGVLMEIIQAYMGEERLFYMPLE